MRKTLVVLLLVASLFAFVSCKDVKYTDEIASLNGVVYSSLQKAIDDAADGDTVKLLCNVTGKGAEIGSSITLDFGGHTYTFDDNVEIGTKKEGLPAVGLRIKAGANVSLKNAKLEAAETFAEPLISSEGILKLEETTLAPLTLKIALDIISGEVRVDADSSVSGVVNISSNDTAKINFAVEPEEVFYTGAVEGKITYKGENPTTAITASTVAIGNKGYADLTTALGDLKTGDILSLLGKTEVTNQIEIVDGLDVTLNLNGCNLIYKGDDLKSGVVLVHNGAKLTVTGNGKITSDNSGTDKAYAAIALTKAGDDNTKVAELVVENGEFEGLYYAICGNGTRDNTKVTINDGIFKGKKSSDNSAIYHPQVGTLVINGGTFSGYNSAVEIRAGNLEINGGSFVAESSDFECVNNGSGSTTTGAAIAIAQHTTKKDIAVTINGGTFTGKRALNESNPEKNDPAPKVTININGGTFNGGIYVDDADFTTLAEGYELSSVKK